MLEFKEFKRNVKRYYDLYGYNAVKEILSKYYNHVSFAQNSIPSAGSMYRNVKSLLDKDNVIINKVVIHRRVDSVTLFTSHGVLRFWDWGVKWKINII